MCRCLKNCSQPELIVERESFKLMQNLMKRGGAPKVRDHWFMTSDFLPRSR